MIRERLEQQQQCEGMQWERTKKRSLHCVIENWKEMVPNTLEWHFSGSLYLSLALFKPFSIKFYCKSILITFNWFLHFDMNVWLTEESKREKKKYIKYDIITVYGERRRIERVAKKGLNALRTINARTEQQKREKQQHTHNIRSILRNEIRYSSHPIPWENFQTNFRAFFILAHLAHWAVVVVVIVIVYNFVEQLNPFVFFGIVLWLLPNKCVNVKVDGILETNIYFRDYYLSKHVFFSLSMQTLRLFWHSICVLIYRIYRYDSEAILKYLTWLPLANKSSYKFHKKISYVWVCGEHTLLASLSHRSISMYEEYFRCWVKYMEKKWQ